MNDHDETFTEELPCKLTETQERERGRKAAQLNKHIADLEHALKAEQKRAKQQIEQLKAEAGALLEAVRTGQERRPVECIQRANTTTEQLEKVRTDTAEVFWSRPLTSAELTAAKQVPMRFADAGGERQRVRKPAAPEPAGEPDELTQELTQEDHVHAYLNEPAPEHDDDGVVPDSEPEPAAGNLPGKLVIDEDDDDGPVDPFTDSDDDDIDPDDEDLFDG